ncbi:hypothetical protein G4177_23820 [Corallococcus sp. ZKHCc1 1396]|uniref:Uncharacterized protein n=1 Tax=Corallococcus soli TaxID=2710757 RepID=A0ABR9PTE8_9BACT|nr:hypothetical protein [Corallococcus soli]MBE4751208.1 hypothetical protein [Corallococcus soli]
MRHWLFVMVVGVLTACSDKPPVSPPPTPDAGSSETDAGIPASGVERPGTLERPPGDRLPEELKPPSQ